jgi:nicotinamidase-related amidase
VNGAPAQDPDLHGSVPDSSPVALLLIDVINDLTFEGAEALLPQAVAMARRLADLKRRAHDAGIPAIYINDNFGRWRSDFRALIQHCGADGMPGAAIVRALEPQADDYFVLKPKHSAFFETTLDTLLKYLGARTLIVTGIAGNICILFSANDAYMRDYKVIVPADCVASNTPEATRYALQQMAQVLKADITPSDALDLEALVRA